MAQTWPGTLPDNFSTSGYSQTPPDILIRQSMDVGPAKVRPRFTMGDAMSNGSMIMTTTQVGTLDTFYTDTLESGNLTFFLNDPVRDEMNEMKFLSPPVYSSLGAGYWRVAMNIRVVNPGATTVFEDTETVFDDGGGVVFEDTF